MMNRSKSALLRRRKKPEATRVEPHDQSDSMAVAALEYRQSIMFRPKSAGNAKQRRSLSRPRTSAQESRDAPISNPPFRYGGQVMEFKAGLDTFNFPTPRSATFPSPEKTALTAASPMIGVALGSPSQAPPSFKRSYTADQNPKTMTSHVSSPHRLPTSLVDDGVATQMDQGTEVRKKKSGWKAFSSLFRSKSSRTVGPRDLVPYDADLHPPMHYSPQLRALGSLGPWSPDLPARSPSTIGRHHSRTPSWTRGQARLHARSETDRASFMPHMEAKMHRAPSVRSSGLPSPRANPVRATLDIFKPQNELRHDSPLSADPPRLDVAIPRTPRLDLDIPGPEMERYSVMFGKLLANEGKPSLLERRQSKLQRLNSRCDGERAGVRSGVSPQVPPGSGRLLRSQSALSPQPGRVGSLAINVGSNSRPMERYPRPGPVTAFHRPRPERSATAPVTTSVAVSAPLVKSMTSQDMDVEGSLGPSGGMSSPEARCVPAVPVIAESSSDSARSITLSEGSLPRTPQTAATFFDDRSSVDTRLDTPEPEWEMLTATMAEPDIKPDIKIQIQGTPPSKVLAQGMSPTNADDLPQRPQSRLRNHRPEVSKIASVQDLERQIIQVSVARQVSVSRARGRVERALSSKQPMRPRVIELSRSRQSTVGVLEHSDEVE